MKLQKTWGVSFMSETKQFATVLFGACDWLLRYEYSPDKDFIKRLGVFTEEAFAELYDRVADETLEEVHMDDKDVVIYYAVLHTGCRVLLHDTHDYFCKSQGESEESIKNVRDKTLHFSKGYIMKFEKDFMDIPGMRQVQEGLKKSNLI